MIWTTNDTSSPVKWVKLHGQHGLGLGVGSRFWIGHRLQPSLQALHWSGHQALQYVLHIDSLVGLANADDGGGWFQHLHAGRFRQTLLRLLHLWGQRRYEQSRSVVQIRPVKDAGELLLSNTRVWVGKGAFPVEVWCHRMVPTAVKCCWCFCRRYTHGKQGVRGRLESATKQSMYNTNITLDKQVQWLI